MRDLVDGAGVVGSHKAFLAVLGAVLTLVATLEGAREADAAKLSGRPTVSLRGASVETRELCGVRGQASVGRVGKPVSARIHIVRRDPQTRRLLARRGAPTRLKVERCGTGGREFISARTTRVKRRGTLGVDSDDPGDYRLELQVRLPRRHLTRRVLYLHVRDEAVSQRVSFAVQNRNRSMLACSSDGNNYTIAGRLVAPLSVLRSGPGLSAATLYLHEFSFGRWFWNFTSNSDYDLAAKQAEAGHVSVVVDRLGYGESSEVDGNSTCIGAHADMAAQVVAKLRSGDYKTERASAPRFRRVALAGHSVGGAIAELMAYSFGNVDALVIFGWADQGFSQRSISQTTKQGTVCLQGGEPARPGGRGGYAPFAPTAQDFQQNVFYDAEPGVVASATGMRTLDPCGDVSSLTPATLLNNQNVQRIAVPLLLVFGRNDAIFEPGAPSSQKQLYSGSRDTTLELIDRSGHALALERSAPTTRAKVSAWLAKRGF